MSRELAVAKIFEYNPEGIKLTGFKHAPVLTALGRTLGSEVLWRENQREVGGRMFVYPSFFPDFIEKRQAFFKRVDTSHRVRKGFFDNGVPDIGNLRDYKSFENFLELCDQVYKTLETAKSELKPFSHLPEARAVLRRVNGLDSGLETMLRTLRRIDRTNTFALDTERGVIGFLKKMPDNSVSLRGNEDQSWDLRGDTLYKLRLRMKRQVVGIAKEVGLELQKGIFDFVRNEFKPCPGEQNLRGFFEQLALPIKLSNRYNRFLGSCEEYDSNWVKEYGSDCDVDIRVFSDLLESLDRKGGFIVRDLIYPEFGCHYDIRGLFPPSLMSSRSLDDPFIPIDFRTKRGERKFLFATPSI